MDNKNGFTLLEILITIVILSIGLLGLALLQTKSVKFNYNSQLRSTALIQLNNMVDRMLSNKEGIKNGKYNTLIEQVEKPSCEECNSEEIAILDYYEWNAWNKKLLPQGLGKVVGDNTDFTISIMWDNERTGATGTNCSGNTAVDLTCIKYHVTIT